MNDWPPKIRAIAVVATILTAGITYQVAKNHLGVDVSNTGTSPSPSNGSSISNKSDELMRIGLLVQTKQGYTVGEVEVIVVSKGAPTRKVSDRNGYIEIEIPKRKSVEVLFQKSGFKPTREIINLEVDPATTKKILLEKN
jgi:hypothetical protein